MTKKPASKPAPKAPRKRPVRPPFAPPIDPSTLVQTADPLANVATDPHVRAAMAKAAQNRAQPVPVPDDLRDVFTEPHKEGEPPVPEWTATADAGDGRGVISAVAVAILAVVILLLAAAVL